MEFPRTSQIQGSPAECDSAKETVDPKSSEGLDSGGQEAPIHGLSGFGIISLGDEDDGRRAMSPIVTTSMITAMNPAQANPTGSGGVNGVDSVMMISLDDILDDLQKKVSSVEGNHVCEVKDQPANPVEEKPGESVAQEVGTEAIEGMGNECKSEAVNSQRGKDEVASSPRRDQGAVPQGTNEQYKGGDGGSHGTDEQHKGEIIGSQGTNEQHEGEIIGSQGAIGQQHKGEAAGPEGMNEQSKGGPASSVEQLEKAVVQAVGGQIGAVCRTPLATDKSQEKPYRHIEVIESPDWLPKGWSTELKTRGAGSSAGTKDKVLRGSGTCFLGFCCANMCLFVSSFRQYKCTL